MTVVRQANKNKPILTSPWAIDGIESPLPRLRRYFPLRGRFAVLGLPPLGEVARSGEGGLVLVPLTPILRPSMDEEHAPSPAFPAKAGIQTLSHRLVARGAPSSFDGLRMRNVGLVNSPHAQPSPPQGGKGLTYPRRYEHHEATPETGADLGGRRQQTGQDRSGGIVARDDPHPRNPVCHQDLPL